MFHCNSIVIKLSFHLFLSLLLQGQSAEWTNEKHNSYLDCLEASFVEQLHKLHDSASMCLVGCHSAKTPSSGQVRALSVRYLHLFVCAFSLNTSN